jgi:predicted transcriptional regulator
MKERPQVNIRLDRALLAEIDDLAQAERVDRSEIARRLLDAGLSTYRGEIALREYRRGGVTAWKAAEIAGVSLYEMLDRIHEAGVSYELDPDVVARLGERMPARAVGEVPQSYSSDGTPDETSGIAGLREQFRPELVKTLFGGTHFYRGNSNLFRATQAAFARAFGADAVPDGPRFLHYFRDQGCWLVDLADRPVNRLQDRERTAAVARGSAALADVIESVQPERIVVVKASIARAVREAATKAGFDGEIVELPFPVRQWRDAYVSQLAAALTGTNALDHSR